MEKLTFLFLFASIYLINGQIHYMEVEEFIAPFDNIIRCAGSLFNETSVVIPANCIDGLSLEQIRVRLSRRVGNTVSSNAQNIIAFEVHPNYDQTRPNSNNIAVVRHTMRHPELRPRSLSRFSSGITQCKILGFVRRDEVLRNYFDDPITVYPPSHCGYNDPHAYCAVFNSTIHPTCSFLSGSPVSCDDGSTTAGILHSEVCVRRNFTNPNGEVVVMPMMRLTSMSLFHEWNSGNFVKSSTFGILIISLMTILFGY